MLDGMAREARAERGFERQRRDAQDGDRSSFVRAVGRAAAGRRARCPRVSIRSRWATSSPAPTAPGTSTFTLDAYGDKYLIRFAGDPEVYVLYADHAPLGGRALKYDSGAMVIRVAGWGGVTLYTDAAPGGVPAERTGDSLPPSPGQISLFDMQNAAEDEAEHLAYSRRIHLTFTADWNALAGDTRMRALCFDAMENAARGIDRFVTNAQGARRLRQEDRAGAHGSSATSR